MVWTEQHDYCLCREIIAADPFTDTKKGTVLRSSKWSEVASELSNIKDISSPFRVDKRSVRDRYNLIAERFRRKMKAEEKASGIDTELTEVEEALQLITEKEDASEEMQKEQSETKKSRMQADKEGAEDMRQKAMEKLSETRKRQVKEDNKTTPSKRRTGGNDTITFLKEKHETNVGLAKLDREIREKQLEAEATRHTETLTMFQQQQQLQMQCFQQMMAQQHQQQQQYQREQAEFMKNLFDKLTK